jgi:hypothetical protein
VWQLADAVFLNPGALKERPLNVIQEFAVKLGPREAASLIEGDRVAKPGREVGDIGAFLFRRKIETAIANAAVA